jgi:phage terminase large subunit-like protein
MNPVVQRLLGANKDQRREILTGLKPEELAIVFRELEEIERTPPRRWFCARETCNGNPHVGFHWCEHPIDGQHTPFCKHARTPQRPPADGSNTSPWLTWFFSGGRGTGKTRAGAEWVLDLVWNQGYKRIALVGRTPADVRDVMIYGDSGIMNCSPPNVRPQHEPTKRRLIWPNGAQAFTYSAAAPSQLRGPQHDAAWCVLEGELVTTARGEIPIEQVVVGDLVATRDGWKQVLAATMTNPDAEVLEIHSEAGNVLRCTPNHRVWVNGDWVLAESIVPSDRVLAWISHTDPQRGSSETEAAGTVPKASTTKTGQGACFMSSCGSIATEGGSRLTRSCTTSTASHSPSSAISVELTTKASVCERGSAPKPVATSTSVSAVFQNGQRGAVYDLTVEGAHEFFAGGILVHNCDELAAWTDAPKGDTLDTSWNNLMLGLRLGQVPRCLVTTTPKRVKLVRQVMERRTTVVTNGSTYENLDNLAPAFREQVLASYEGTRIGEQELKGVLLTDVEGALWTMEMIDNARGEFWKPAMMEPA